MADKSSGRCSSTSAQMTLSKACVREGQPEGVTLHRPSRPARGDLSGLDHRSHRARHAFDFDRVRRRGRRRPRLGGGTQRRGVRRRNRGRGRGRRAQAEPAEVDGQHAKSSKILLRRGPGRHLPGEALGHSLGVRRRRDEGGAARRKGPARWPGQGRPGRQAGRAGRSPRSLRATSGSAPPVVATTATPQAIASIAGRENPS